MSWFCLWRLARKLVVLKGNEFMLADHGFSTGSGHRLDTGCLRNRWGSLHGRWLVVPRFKLSSRSCVSLPLGLGMTVQVSITPEVGFSDAGLALLGLGQGLH